MNFPMLDLQSIFLHVWGPYLNMLSETQRGCVYMTLAMAGYAFNDAIVKVVAEDVDLYQSIFIRGLFSILFIGVFAHATGAFKVTLNARDLKLVMLRSIAEAMGAILFLTALLHTPIASITAILQTQTLVISLVAAWIFKESIGPIRAISIVVGLMGVLLIIKPGGDDFNFYSLLGVVTVFLITARDILVRLLSANLSSLFLAFVTSVVVTLTGLIAMLAIGSWKPITLYNATLLAIAGGLIFVGYFYTVASLRSGELVAVTPFRYTIMIWSILLGYFVWSEIPDIWSALGMFIIAAMGLITFWRESKSKD